jgi:hypothetical protein
VVCVCSTHRRQSSGYDDLQPQAAVDEERSEFEAAFRLRFTMADAIIDAEIGSCAALEMEAVEYRAQRAVDADHVSELGELAVGIAFCCLFLR